MAARTRAIDGPSLFDKPAIRPIPIATIPSAEYSPADEATEIESAAATPVGIRVKEKPSSIRASRPKSGSAPPLVEPAKPEPSNPAPARSAPSRSAVVDRRGSATAETMATKQREISVSEFFAKNRHLLGFDNKRKALLTTVKEAVDNSLDACEEAGILPEIHVLIDQLAEDRFRVTVRDNGPGIVKAQIPNVFGKLLYGSKFHRLKMSRGQQGIGISAAGMYGLHTTGKPIHITSRTGAKKPAHHFQIAIDTTKNRPDIVLDEEFEVPWESGTEVVIELVANYAKGRQSVDEYIEQTAIANPHAQFRYRSPTGEHRDFPRGTNDLPPETREIQPHPYGIELGILMKMLKEARPHEPGKRTPSLSGFLQNEFCRVSSGVAQSICQQAKLSQTTNATALSSAEAERLFQAMQSVKIMAPPTDCLAPIGVRSMLAGLVKELKAEFFAATTRPPAVYRGNPFQIEIALAYGGSLPAEEAARVIRFANRVPLLYQQSACSAFKSVLDVDWRNYGISQPGNGGPVGPLVVMVHMASVWVPFTSESKEAIADYDEIRKEIKLALQECGRKLATYIRRRRRQRLEADRRDIFERYIPDVASALEQLTSQDAPRIAKRLQEIARRRTAEADVELDEDGKPIEVSTADATDPLSADEGVVIVSENEVAAPPTELIPTDSPAGRRDDARKKAGPRRKNEK